MKITKKESINGVFSMPGDSSISHIAIVLSSFIEGTTTIDGISPSNRCVKIVDCVNRLGIQTEYNIEQNQLKVSGKGLRGLSKPEAPLDIGEDYEGASLFLGVLAACPFESRLTGNESVLRNLFDKTLEPFKKMGVGVKYKDSSSILIIQGNANLKPISCDTGDTDTLVKTSLLLAGIFSQGETIITEPRKTKDHMEIMLKYLGADIKIKTAFKGNTIIINGQKSFRPYKFIIPGDVSVAAYLIGAALILPNSRIIITHVGVNLTRTGIITALRDMGAHVEVVNRRVLCGEYVADIVASTSELVGTVVEGGIIRRISDELPLLLVLALFADGKTIIEDAAHIIGEESSLITGLINELKKFGANIEAADGKLIIYGGGKLQGARVDCHNDYRLAQALSVVGMMMEGETDIANANGVKASYPGFFDAINR